MKPSTVSFTQPTTGVYKFKVLSIAVSTALETKK